VQNGQPDAFDRRLVHALLIAPRAPFRQLAAVLRVSDQTVRRRYASLGSALGLRVLGRLDSSLVGRVDWILRLRCTPDAAVPVGSALARRPDTSWVRLASGGTEIHCLFQPRGPEERDTLLLDRLTGSRRVLGVSAHALLHTFSSVAWPELTRALTAHEIASLRDDAEDPGQESGESPGAPVHLSQQDETLARLLAKDGRATAAALAAGTGWHESTVRRRIAQLQRAGALYFDVDLDERVLGSVISAELWISAEPSALTAVGTAIAAHPEVPFAGATTGPTNLLASVVCTDTGQLYRYLTTQIGELAGVRHVETAPTIRTLKRAGSLVPG
jgi:DNA-binding Lrp family transcriptional regulator